MQKHSGMYLTFFFQALIAANALYAFYFQQYQALFFATMAFILTFVPTIVAQRLQLQLPWFLFFLVALSLWFHLTGHIQEYYLTFFPYYDKIAHLISGITVALLGFLGVIFLDFYYKMRITPVFIIFFTIIFGMALGAFWEILEFAIDQTFGGSFSGPMQFDLNDTMWDMIFVLMGSCITAIYGIVWFRNNTKESIMAKEE